MVTTQLVGRILSFCEQLRGSREILQLFTMDVNSYTTFFSIDNQAATLQGHDFIIEMYQFYIYSFKQHSGTGKS